MTAILDLKSVSKRYGKKLVLDGVSVAFQPGLTLLTGPSGAGKSTLLRLCATAERPSGGDILWAGQKLPGARERLRRVLGYAPQAVDLPEELTAREFVLHLAALKGLKTGEADRQFLALAEAVGLHADANNRISGFSGGMRRRLVLLQALLGQPQLICLDEPTAELDTDSRQRVAALITRAAQSAIVLMTTHLEDGVATQARAVLRVDGGRVQPA
ncbi:MAG: ATP-binding cassette domain-containing protein [Caulobacteraceae bacterium]|nr:ATP-binding cassette domain-containing protein [Caulobacteraceae bacterium]